MPATAANTAIADALADVTVAARDVMVERVELTRVGLHEDARQFAGALALGGLAVVAIAIAASTTAVALVVLLGGWIGVVPAAAIVGGLALAAAVGLTRMARSRLPGRSSFPAALPAAPDEKEKA